MTYSTISREQMREKELLFLREKVSELQNKIDKLTKFVDHCAYQLDMQYAREVLEELDEN